VRAVLLLALSALTREVAAQLPTGHEVAFAGLATLSDPAQVGGAVGYAVRPGGRIRVAGLAGLGARDGTVVGRGELTLHYLLAPDQRHGAGFYGFGGVAGVTGRHAAGYLVLGAGVEGAPGGWSGWYLEAGVGGGARLSLGWRFRWLRRVGGPP
jgi:hypothetical protein